MMQAVNEVPHISPEEAQRRAAQGKAVLIDVREPDEVRTVAIMGAVNVPLTLFDPQAVLDAAGDKDIVFFCKIGGRAMNACHHFIRQTGREAACMSGSIAGWMQKGLPVISKV
ncbi:MAG: rhodanese-like domain-containing protein [Micavibrio aeruginosavorus]|uniref:Rhodanese-like domain-containing protein n=1 Tax=Micavibrio aeruginosavorus TaxID=349221 RepID=A0A7T5R0Q1_9BACT|nr:MAG: rhodanese-like domain-containing protein [Micavibrio aeruginosavorus]